MNAEILCIGTEVLIGEVVNTNAAYISERLSAAGINVYYHSVCGDNKERIKSCLKLALSRSDAVIMTGGLGPTYDDITKEIVAETLCTELVLHEEILLRLESYFEKSGRKMTENNKKQAYIPKGATIFENRFGTADGIAIRKDGKTVVMLPGPPREMKPMLDADVLPYLAAESDHILVSQNINIFGLGESSVENALSDIMKSSDDPTIAPYVNNGEVRLRLTAKGKDEKEAKEKIKPVAEKIISVLGDVVYGINEPSIESVLVRELKKKKKRIAFAESCTGGLISKRITDVSGASEVFGYGFVTYANEAKENLLGVESSTLEAYGAVSEQTAKEMALGTLSASGADIAVSVTGIAGPTGGTEDKPVGLVYMGVATKDTCFVKKLLLATHSGHDRSYVRTLTATHAFKAALDVLKNL